MRIYGLYYALKPYTPLRIRVGLRRWLAPRLKKAMRDSWPILERAGKQPSDWHGWPDGKRFALVLTHDVESRPGLDRCERLMKLESELGFCSSINLVPEGSYRIPPSLMQSIIASGFELGVHDLKHDGKLFSSRKRFEDGARRINEYLREWKAVGFRAGLMHHNLEWIRSLNLAYDASTFDTDPFEPQPDGMQTIFPFWVPRNDGSGFVELPYTLPQDFTLFIIHRENSIAIWKQKLDWVAARGGMALVNTHPDFMNFSDGKPAFNEYPAAHYRSFLEYAKSRYGGEYWHALPRTVAHYVTDRVLEAQHDKDSKPKVHFVFSQPRKIWIDLDNTPHVPFFEPIIKALEERGYSILLTGRDAFQVCELAAKKNMKIIRVGRHHGKNRIAKLVGLHNRALQLLPHAFVHKPVLGISHGSRSQVISCRLLNIPSVMIGDYEHARFIPFERPSWAITPEIIPSHAVNCEQSRILKYPGIKEDVYVPYFKPDMSLPGILGLNAQCTIVTVRPPATEAHYHNPLGEVLFSRLMEKLHSADAVQVIMLPRNRHQSEQLHGEHPEWFEDGKVIVPRQALDGLNLIWHSDLVVSGGGTMNREAAALGVPVYSIFKGKIGAVDRDLNRQGKLILIDTEAEIDSKIQLKRRDRRFCSGSGENLTLDTIIAHIDRIYQEAHP
jgi:uncharacterized protein